jgi:hypothetical protein
MEGGHLCIWVIYKDAADMPPGCFAVRRWTVHPGATEAVPDPYAVAAPTLELARELITENVGYLYRLPPDPNDDPVIVESWL